ncbi:MAG: hypothetical protein JXQ29_00300 [Planctomycetes bacterium]|nr:hypothetical protein [Planctomycetota bacterium]
MTTDERLARLERQCRLFKTGFALTAITLVTVLLVGAGQDQEKAKLPVFEEVCAKRFVVMAEDGTPRGALAAERYGASLQLHDSKKEVQAELSVRTRLEGSAIGSIVAGAGLTMDSYGSRIDILNTPGIPQIAVSNGEFSAHLAVPKEGPTLVFGAKDGKVIFKAPQ